MDTHKLGGQVIVLWRSSLNEMRSETRHAEQRTPDGVLRKEREMGTGDVLMVVVVDH